MHADMSTLKKGTGAINKLTVLSSGVQVQERRYWTHVLDRRRGSLRPVLFLLLPHLLTCNGGSSTPFDELHQLWHPGLSGNNAVFTRVPCLLHLVWTINHDISTLFRLIPSRWWWLFIFSVRIQTVQHVNSVTFTFLIGEKPKTAINTDRQCASSKQKMHR